MTYSLRRTRDGAGDSGQMSVAIIPPTHEGEKPVFLHNARPQVGAIMRVGSHYPRSFSSQDWWQTTLITEILEDTPKKVVFKTGNSIYEWTCT